MWGETVRIVMVTPRLVPWENGVVNGGAVNAMRSLAGSLAEEGLADVEVAAGVPENNLRWLGRARFPCAVHPIPMSAEARTARYFAEFALRCTAWGVRHLRSGNVDVVHFHSGYVHYSAAALLFRQRLGLPTVHSLYCPVSSLEAVLARPVVSRLDGVVAMSHNVLQSLRLGVTHRTRVRQIPPAIRRETPSEMDRQEVRRQLVDGSDTRVVMFVGGAGVPAKGLDVLLEAMGRVVGTSPKVRLVLLVDDVNYAGYEDVWTRLRTRIATLGLERAVLWVGLVPQIHSYVAAADLIVLPFRHTRGPSDYPLVLLEAMSLGTPVLATRVGGVPEVIKDRVTGFLVPPGDPGALADGLSELLADASLRRSVVSRAGEWIRDHCDGRRVARQHLAVYRETRLGRG